VKPNDPCLSERPTLVPFARFRWDELRRQHQIVFPEGVIVLTETAEFIVEHCDGRTIDSLVAAVGKRFDSDVGVLDDVLDILIQLNEKGLLQDAGAA